MGNKFFLLLFLTRKMALRFALLLVALGVAEVRSCSVLPCWFEWPVIGKAVVSGGSRHTRVVEIWQLLDQLAAWQRINLSLSHREAE
jgi:hypothetical protein